MSEGATGSAGLATACAPAGLAGGPPRGPKRWGLRAKLFVSYLVVVAAGLATVLLATALVAPTFFAGHMAQMMGGPAGLDAMARMMGGSAPSGAAGGAGMAGVAGEALTASFRAALNQALLLGGVAAGVTALVVSAFVSGRVVGPVQRLAAASRRIAAGHYAERVPASPAAPADELDDLAASFNDMAAALEANERRRLDLIGDVAHELRTPVATLQGYLEGLLDGVVAPEPATWARLHDEAGRLRRLIDDLQELSRAEARQFSLQLEPVEPAAIVEAALGPLESAFAEKGLAVHVDVPPALPRVQADRDRAVQVMTNLLTNALRYTPAPGTAEIAARPVDGAIEFSVTDTGIGVAAEHLPHLFERFYRVDRSRSRALGGSGIGLTTSRALVEAMGGHIRADSRGLGEGTTVTMALPLAR